MQVFLHFSPDFLEWALAIARKLKSENPSCRITGLASGPLEVYRQVVAAQDLEIDCLHRLDDLERDWLSQPVGPESNREIERRFGPEIRQRLIVADRDLGRGFVSGGLTAETALSRIARDPVLLDRYVVGLLDYCERQLRGKAIDMVFCHSVNDAPSLALGLASQALGIPFGQIRHTRIGSRVIIDTSPFDDLEPVRDRFERILLTNRFPSGTRAAAEDYLRSARALDTAPDYLDYHKRRIDRQHSLAGLLRMAATSLRAALRDAAQPEKQVLRRRSPLRLCALELRAAVATRVLLRRRPFLQPGARPAGPFAFFPLHVDPEASTMVQSPMHTDQLSLVESVAKGLPAGTSLLVKEHIPMLGRRPAGFYERLGAFPGVFLASPFDSGGALVREAALTVVISSTAGWEAMLFGKPTVVMAYPPYSMVNDGFVHCPDPTRLPEAIRQALGQNPADERRLMAYVAAALSCSMDCPTEALWGKVTAQSVAARPAILKRIVADLLEIASRRPGTDSGENDTLQLIG